MITRRNKFGNKKVSAFGMTFDSKKEMMRYAVLCDAQKRGEISDLKCQVKYELIPAITVEHTRHLKTKDKVVPFTVQRAITYIADFEYKKGEDVIVEDVKISEDLLPKEFVLKEKIFRWRYGFAIKRVYKANDPI